MALTAAARDALDLLGGDQTAVALVTHGVQLAGAVPAAQGVGADADRGRRLAEGEMGVHAHNIAHRPPVDNAGVEISVKNSGHDYMTRSSGKGTLNLWTHSLQGMTYHSDFKPSGSSHKKGPAMTVMAGVQALDAYNFADAHDSIIMGPYAPSVTNRRATEFHH